MPHLRLSQRRAVRQRPAAARSEHAAAAPAIDSIVVAGDGAHKRADPVFFFAGGPGQSAIALAPRVMPCSRACPAAATSSSSISAAPAARRRSTASATKRCRWPSADVDAPSRLMRTAAGGSRRYRRRPAPVHDGDRDGRRRRGARGARAPRVNLVGGSYGTRAALEYLRQFPQRVRRVVIDGVAPPDMALPESQALDAQAALDALFAAAKPSPPAAPAPRAGRALGRPCSTACRADEHRRPGDRRAEPGHADARGGRGGRARAALRAGTRRRAAVRDRRGVARALARRWSGWPAAWTAARARASSRRACTSP